MPFYYFMFLILLVPICNCLHDILLNITEVCKSYCAIVITRNNLKIQKLENNNQEQEYHPMGFEITEGEGVNEETF